MRAIWSGLAGIFLCLAGGLRAAGQEQPPDYQRALEDYKASYEGRLTALEAQVAQMRGEMPPPAPGYGRRAEEERPPLLSLHGFGDVEYDLVAANPRTGESNSRNHFTTGDLDLFITSQIAEDVSFLSETLFEAREDGEYRLDVERLQIRYTAADWFALSAGRGHTALGYWNQRFHHGKWLQLTAAQPLVYLFEDEGGILPDHFVGLELDGRVEIGEASLAYSATVGNGRGVITNDIQTIEDENDSKVLGFLSTLYPIEDLGIGFSVLRDWIPAAPNLDPSRIHSIDELIYGGHVFYEVYPFDFAAEILAISHDDHTSGRTFDHYGGYIQFGRAFGVWTPYYRYDFLNIEDGDPYYMEFVTGRPFAETSSQQTFGLRWDVRSYLALKSEYRWLRSSSSRDSIAVLQASFAF
jgi:hypothetical protein